VTRRPALVYADAMNSVPGADPCGPIDFDARRSPLAAAGAGPVLSDRPASAGGPPPPGLRYGNLLPAAR